MPSAAVSIAYCDAHRVVEASLPLFPDTEISGNRVKVGKLLHRLPGADVQFGVFRTSVASSRAQPFFRRSEEPALSEGEGISRGAPLANEANCITAALRRCLLFAPPLTRLTFPRGVPVIRAEKSQGVLMNRKWFTFVGIIAAAGLLLSLPSCGRNQDLVSITVSPHAFTYFAPAVPGAPQTPIPLTAYGSYIHPPATKNITSQVTWASNNTIVADVDNAGNLTDGVACGVANISASFFTDGGNKNGNVVVGFMTVTVEGPASQGCPTGGATHNLSVNVTSGAADGVIVSSPAGINCGTTCTAAFGAGSSVALTATPSGTHTFGTWGGCTTVSGNTCNVTMNSDVTVTASFN